MTFDLKRNALQGAGGLPGVRDCHIMAKFFPLKVTKEAITAVEYEDPFEHMKMFGLVGVESKALTLEDVPQEYRPYKGCLFVSGQCYSAEGVSYIGSCASINRIIICLEPQYWQEVLYLNY